MPLFPLCIRLVCDAMGGPVDIKKQHDFLWELHLSELKIEMQSNIIPIGKIKKGTYYHRALLFKVGIIYYYNVLLYYVCCIMYSYNNVENNKNT